MTSNSNSNSIAKIKLDQSPVVLEKFEDVRLKYRVDPKVRRVCFWILEISFGDVSCRS